MTLVTNADDAAVPDAIIHPAVQTARSAIVFRLPNRRAARSVASGNNRIGGNRRSFGSGDHAPNNQLKSDRFVGVSIVLAALRNDGRAGEMARHDPDGVGKTA